VSSAATSPSPRLLLTKNGLYRAREIHEPLSTPQVYHKLPTAVSGLGLANSRQQWANLLLWAADTLCAAVGVGGEAYLCFCMVAASFLFTTPVFMAILLGALAPYVPKCGLTAGCTTALYKLLNKRMC
jgi:hypothetical protein